MNDKSTTKGRATKGRVSWRRLLQIALVLAGLGWVLLSYLSSAANDAAPDATLRAKSRDSATPGKTSQQAESPGSEAAQDLEAKTWDEMSALERVQFLGTNYWVVLVTIAYILTLLPISWGKSSGSDHTE